MSKTLNKCQCDTLLNRMQEKPDIARGFVKENRDKVTAFWKELTLELNSTGPPIKTENEWKKVWIDQRRYVRKKATLNNLRERGTGGGPNRTQKLSPTEETIFELVGMKEAVEGVSTSQYYGLPQAEKRRKISNLNQTAQGIQDEAPPEESPQCSGDYLPSVPLCENQVTPRSNSDKPTPNSQTSRGKADKMTTNEVVLKELAIQEELCAKIGESIIIMKEHNKEMVYSARKIYRSLDRIQDQLNLQLKETKRHNFDMAKFKTREIESKIERNRRMIELEEIKVDILRNE